MDEAALKIRGLVKRFSGFQLGPLDLTVPRGAIYGLIGPNGAGKTTTLDLVMGMGREDEGKVEVFGYDHVKDEVEAKKRIGYFGPDLVFNAWGKVGRIIDFFRGFYADWDDDYCLDLLRRFRLGRDERILTLSFGARTKLGLVLALSHRPPLLLLDEPLNGLDALAKREVFAELLDAVQDENRTAVISSHNLDELERYADHVAIIDKGKLLLEGPTTDVVERFQTVDATAANGAVTVPGARLITRDGQRSRFLLDTAKVRVEDLPAYGLEDVATAPVTLEELLVALVKETEEAKR